MATCFGPLPPSKRLPPQAFDLTLGRPPRCRRPPRVQRVRPHTCSRSLDETPPRRLLSSTYRSFRESNEDEILPQGEEKGCRSARCKRRKGEDVFKRRTFAFDEERPRKRDRYRSRTIDGYYSDTTLLPNKIKPFLSTFKSDDNDFETALLTTLKEKSKSSQNLSLKPAMSPRLKPVSIPSGSELVLKPAKRSVTFSDDSDVSPPSTPPGPPPPCRFSVLQSELPTLSFQQLFNAANTRHPKSLYSTTRYPKLRLTIFAGGECVSPAIRLAELAEEPGPTPAAGSLKRRKTRPGRLFRSHSEGNLAEQQPLSPLSPLLGPLGLGNASISRCLRVLSGSWRNLLNLGGMSRAPKAPMAKKVAPPAVPDVFRHSGSSFGSAGYASSEDGFMPLPPPDGQSNVSDGSELYGMGGKSPGPGGQFNYQSFTFPGKGAYCHHQQSLQEDQGIDMTQSPGRDSPGSSGSGSGSRHSTASLDSGRASGSHLLTARAPGSGSTLSSSPRCSISSSSIVSSELSLGARVERLIRQGAPDQEIVLSWLQELHFEEYFSLFAAAGYDMPTISRMTPEDLTAIGIKKPNHRKKLKAEIASLNISDGLPEYIPGSMEEWLTLLRLDDYGATLRSQGYQTVEDVTQLAWEDLEEAGVVRLGHQKRLLLAIKRVKDIRAGKRFSQVAGFTHVTQVELHTPSPSLEDPHSLSRPYHLSHPPARPPCSTPSWEESSLTPRLQLLGFPPLYCTDIVPIKIRGGRGKSLESLEDGERTASHHTFSPENTGTFYYPSVMGLGMTHGGWRRSYDDGDITPTNDAMMSLHEGGGTLPRPRGLVRPRPVAKIPATRNATPLYCEKPSYNIYDLKQFNNETMKDSDLIQSDLTYEMSEKNPSPAMPPSMAPLTGLYDYKLRLTGPRGCVPCGTTGRRRPPSPPKRQSSHVETNLDCAPSGDGRLHQTTTIVELHPPAHSALPLPSLPGYPEEAGAELGGRLETLHLGWRAEVEEEESQLIATLAQQARNGSDASFKSSSSTESDSLPFANENAGTIKQRARCQSSDYTETRDSNPRGQEPADVLSDIGNMLANLTDELDAMLEEEKRQGLNLD